MTDVEIILKYQEIFPTLQQDNGIWIDARCLWSELGVKSEYINWIKQQIEDIGLVDKIDYSIDLTLKSNQKGKGGDRKSEGTMYSPTTHITKERT